MRKRIKGSKVCLVLRVSGNLITFSYLDPGSPPSLSSTRPTAFRAWYTCHRSSGGAAGAAVVTGRSVKDAIVLSNQQIVRVIQLDVEKPSEVAYLCTHCKPN